MQFICFGLCCNFLIAFNHSVQNGLIVHVAIFLHTWLGLDMLWSETIASLDNCSSTKILSSCNHGPHWGLYMVWVLSISSLPFSSNIWREQKNRRPPLAYAWEQINIFSWLEKWEDMIKQLILTVTLMFLDFD